IGAWYEGVAISRELIGFTVLLLAGFAITKLPIEKLLGRR
ncbi:EamA family transporter, partial [Pseudomonas aeruginosa]